MLRTPRIRIERTAEALRQKTKNAIHSFNKKQFATFAALVVLAVISGFWLLSILNNAMSTPVPVSGGTLREGIVGAPRFINPVLAASDAEKDLAALVFSGLMKKDSSGAIIPDLAESLTVDPDGKGYTVVIRPKAFFHDGTLVTADDVVYTVQQIQNPLVESPHRDEWAGVSVEKIDARTIHFSLKQTFSPFQELLTIGILPLHLWSDLSPEEFGFSDLNIKAVGAGAYWVSSVHRTSSGIPNEFTLRRFANYPGTSYIKKVIILSYANERDLEDALESAHIDTVSGISPERAEHLKDKGFVVKTSVLPRMIGLFFNQNENEIFKDTTVLSIIRDGIDRQAIISNVLSGYGVAIDKAVPGSFTGTTETVPSVPDVATLENTLDKAGWVIGSDGIRHKSGSALRFSISTADTPELTKAAELVKSDLGALGFDVSVKVYSLGDLNQDVIRPRSFEALFFGQYVTGTASLYAFWSSTETNDPGLNVAMTKDTVVDRTLISILSTPTIDPSLYQKLSDAIYDKSATVFLYSPLYLSVHRNDISVSLPERITSPSDRFITIPDWYINTEKVWNIFLKNN